MANGWIGVDFDGTLVKTVTWDGTADGQFGENIEPMIKRVKQWLDEGREVRIVTARVARGWDNDAKQWLAIRQWCADTFGRYLEVTAEKDPEMIVLWDDRAVQLVRNTGMTASQLEYTNIQPVNGPRA